MKLNDLERKNTATKALKENFDFSLDTSKLDRKTTKAMLSKVVGLVKEAKAKPDFYKNQTSPSYMKLVFMAQALTEHYKSLPEAQIVVENEQVEKSQVILAAQDMVDSIQKMIEEVNDMLVKELPALTDSIQSEIGVNESGTFSQAATQALSNLNATLGQSKQELQGALNSLTGVDAGAAFAAPEAGGEMPVTDVGAAGEVTAPAAGEVDLGVSDELSAELPDEEPEAVPAGGVGRAKR